MIRYFSAIATVFLLAMQLLWSSSSYAINYYVHANIGNNRNSGLQPDNAFANLDYAMQQLRAGDTLYLRSGVYTDTIYAINKNQYYNGTSTAPITVKAYPNETAVISNDKAFGVMDLSWWVFEDLVFQKSAPMILGKRDTSLSPATSQCVSTVENITVRGVRFQHNSSDGIYIQCGRHIKIENSIFDNLRSRKAGIDSFGIYFLYQAEDIVVSGNHFSDIGGDAIHLLDTTGSHYIDIKIIDNEFEIIRPYQYRDENGNIIPESLRPFDNVGENAIDIKQGPGPIVISNNLLHGYRPSSEQDASGSIGSAIIIQNQASGITISANYFVDNTIHLNAGRGNHADTRPDRALSIFNNIFEDAAAPGNYGEQIPSGIRLNGAGNINVLDNTFINQAGHQGWLLQLVETDNVELKNNAFQNGIIAINTDSITNLMANNNAWSGVTGNTYTGEIYPVVLGVNDIITINLGLDPSTLEPLASSLLIDSGTPVGITEDFNGATIAGGGPDIGAVEYQDPNTEMPSTLITSPADGATVSGSVQVTATAVDNTGIAKVTFALDGTWVGRDTTAPYTFNWNSTTHADGIAKLQATAFDLDGNADTYTLTVTINNLGPDTEAPGVAITGPAEGATVSGTVQINATASDNIGVTKVTFAVDGAWVGKDTSAPYTFNWNSSTHADGIAKLQATAYDAAGNTSNYTLYVTTNNQGPDTEKPGVVITGPGKGATVSGDVQISAAATDNIGVTKVTFAIDGVWVGKDTTAPYTFNWDSSTHADGIAKLQAIAFDAAGNTSKHILYVTTNNQGPDTEKPGVVITGPGEGATVSGDVQISAAANDNIGVTKVTFAVEGVWVGKDTSAPYTFNWDSSTHADGIAKLQATAFDAVGNTSNYTLYVTTNNPGSDTEAPSVVITGPGEGATVSGDVQISAAATDNIGVTKVTFAIDGVWVGKDTTAPYTFNWDSSTHADGIAKLQVTAFDAVGNTSKNTLYVTAN